MKIFARSCAVLTATLVFALVPLAGADVPAITYANPQGQAFSLGAESTLGWSFTLSTPMTVTALGFHAFAPNSSGTAPSVAHPVAIWDSNGQQLISGTVPAGNAGTNLNGTFYVSIAPVRLTVGTYTIGAYVPSSTDFVDINDTVTPSPGVTYNGARSNFVSGFSYPSGNQVGYSTFFGPNFLVVPEPATWATLLVGGGLLGFGLRRRLAVVTSR